jgi:hypothetical protein
MNSKNTETILAEYFPYRLIEERTLNSDFEFLYVVKTDTDEIFCSEKETLSDKVFREVVSAYQSGVSAILSDDDKLDKKPLTDKL